MTAQPRELVLLSRAQQALEQAQTIDEIRDVRDKAQLAKAWSVYGNQLLSEDKA